MNLQLIKRYLIIPAIAGVILLQNSVSLLANMRAPYHREYKESGTLVRVEGLVLKSLQISFDFEKYFTGKAASVSEETGYCNIKAVYTAESRTETEAEFTFISPSGESAAAEINDIASPVRVTELGGTPQSNRKRWAVLYEDLYSITFSGKLIQGENTIKVTYRQPMSVDEISYGYFTRSRWSSGVGYEFSPVKEWQLVKGFKAGIDISVPYKRSITDYITGDDIELILYGYDKEYKNRIIPRSEKTGSSGGRLIKQFTFMGDLPDKLRVAVSE